MSSDQEVSSDAEDRMDSLPLVQAFLTDQRWRLVEASELSAEIDQLIRNKTFENAKALKTYIQKQAWGLYGAAVHDRIIDKDHPQYEDAWYDVERWMRRSVRGVTQNLLWREQIVQDVMIYLQKYLQDNPLNEPKALWGYISRCMINKRTDLHRASEAKKRRPNQERSLDDDDDSDEHFTDNDNPRQHDDELVSAET